VPESKIADCETFRTATFVLIPGAGTDPRVYVASARRALDAVARDSEIPPLHVGIHTGPAIYRAGDDIGSTVNLASRVTGASAAGEILLTEAVASELGAGEITEPVGVRLLRGAGRPLGLFRVIRCEERRAPVCNTIVINPTGRTATARE
jgi:class 3 adenylate cyclase